MVNKIIKSVGIECGVSPEEILGKSRHPNISKARHLSMHLVREKTNLTLVEIAKAFNMLDHTAVLYAVRRTKEIIMSDRELRKWVEKQYQ